MPPKGSNGTGPGWIMSEMKIEPVTLAGRFVRLEPLGWGHVAGLEAAVGDAEVSRWTADRLDGPGAVAAMVRSAIAATASGREVAFATVEVASGRVAGSTRFLNIEPAHRRVEIGGTRVGLDWQRTPINTEAKSLMLRHAFEACGAVRVEFKTDALNERSRAAILRLGAVEEGTLRRHMVVQGGRVRDTVYFSILADEWPEVRARLEIRLDRPWPPAG